MLLVVLFPLFCTPGFSVQCPVHFKALYSCITRNILNQGSLWPQDTKATAAPQQDQKCECTIFDQAWLDLTRVFFFWFSANSGCRKNWYCLTGSGNSTGSSGLCCGLCWKEDGLWVAHHKATGSAGTNQVDEAAPNIAGAKFTCALRRGFWHTVHFALFGLNRVIISVLKHLKLIVGMEALLF